ncbi:thermonuclease family protein [Brevundimonas aurantiaca]|jgi:micrococcal nuclease|uniref:thermonuclease family protein n=1 Tax=Brevundimonas aurantiaca TaxID=74316 RepID=UPI00174B49F9|nr:nuclease [Brevundimonas aurantiaca]
MNRTPLSSLALGIALTILAAPSIARADPCEGALPRQGASFSGLVRYVGDGDSLCVGPAGRPERWIEIRLADFNATELNARGGRDAKRLLADVAMGRSLVCRAGRRSYDRVVAACTLDGRPLGDVLRARGAREGGR